MASNVALSKKRKLNVFHQHHKVYENLSFKPDPIWKPFVRKYSAGRDFRAGCVLIPNSNLANGKSIPEFKHSRLVKTTSANGIGKSNLLDIAKGWSVEHRRFCSDKVDETTKLFRKVLSDLKQENNGGKNSSFNLHTKAAIIHQKQGKWLNAEKRLGAVPGVEVYKEFQYRAEMRVIGLHCQLERGIDYVNINGEILATSIVDSGRYFNKTDTVNSLDFLLYYGAGGNPSIHKAKPKDQRLVGGNLALYNSMRKKCPVRVIRKINEFPRKSSHSSKFVYEGLYLVDSFRLVREKYGKLVFKFRLRRQTEKQNPKFGNQPFMRSSGCDCTDGCSDSEDCSCKTKNGGTIPYNYKECLVNPRSLIIECCPSCKCYESCLNRVSQRLRHLQQVRGSPLFELERYRSRLGFLGVRSRCFIPEGSFVCEYEEGIGRLINRSTSPNLFAQNVLYDNKEKGRLHVMLFALEDIPKMKELTI
ncbi:hypothetical protein DITRI_Ditri03aG0001300 [Diplodiscus trichospermus]